MGKVRRYASELSPVPKSSSAMLQPSLRRRRMSTSARERLPIAALSVSSKHKAEAHRPLLSTSCATYSVNSASCSDWPEKFIENTTGLFFRYSAYGLSMSMACEITQRSSVGMSW